MGKEDWINKLAGDFIEDWVAPMIAEAWEKDLQEISDLKVENKRLREGYNYTQYDSRGCPGCVYEDGKFISMCYLHERIEELEHEVNSLEEELEEVYEYCKDRF